MRTTRLPRLLGMVRILELPGIAVPGAAADALGTADADAMFARAIASTLGVVDKIDFDSLVFETDDE